MQKYTKLNNCCPVKLKRTRNICPKSLKTRLRTFFKKCRFGWRFLSLFCKNVIPGLVRIFHKRDKIDVVHERKAHHGDNLRESAVSLDAS